MRSNRTIPWHMAFDYALKHMVQLIFACIILGMAFGFSSENDSSSICSIPLFIFGFILMLQMSFKFLVDGVSTGISIYFDSVPEIRGHHSSEILTTDTVVEQRFECENCHEFCKETDLKCPHCGVIFENEAETQIDKNTIEPPEITELDVRVDELNELQKEINILQSLINIANESSDFTTEERLTKDIKRITKRRAALRKLIGED